GRAHCPIRPAGRLNSDPSCEYDGSGRRTATERKWSSRELSIVSLNRRQRTRWRPSILRMTGDFPHPPHFTSRHTLSELSGQSRGSGVASKGGDSYPASHGIQITPSPVPSRRKVSSGLI